MPASASDRIAELAGRGLDLVTFWRDATEVLRRGAVLRDAVLVHARSASLLVTSHFHEGLDELPPAWLAHEYYEDDVNKLADVARSKRGASRRCTRRQVVIPRAARAGTST